MEDSDNGLTQDPTGALPPDTLAEYKRRCYDESRKTWDAYAPFPEKQYFTPPKDARDEYANKLRPIFKERMKRIPGAGSRGTSFAVYRRNREYDVIHNSKIRDWERLEDKHLFEGSPRQSRMKPDVAASPLQHVREPSDIPAVVLGPPALLLRPRSPTSPIQLSRFSTDSSEASVDDDVDASEVEEAVVVDEMGDTPACSPSLAPELAFKRPRALAVTSRPDFASERSDDDWRANISKTVNPSRHSDEHDNEPALAEGSDYTEPTSDWQANISRAVNPSRSSPEVNSDESALAEDSGHAEPATNISPESTRGGTQSQESEQMCFSKDKALSQPRGMDVDGEIDWNEEFEQAVATDQGTAIDREPAIDQGRAIDQGTKLGDDVSNSEGDDHEQQTEQEAEADNAEAREAASFEYAQILLWAAVVVRTSNNIAEIEKAVDQVQRGADYGNFNSSAAHELILELLTKVSNALQAEQYLAFRYDNQAGEHTEVVRSVTRQLRNELERENLALGTQLARAEAENGRHQQMLDRLRREAHAEKCKGKEAIARSRARLKASLAIKDQQLAALRMERDAVVGHNRVRSSHVERLTRVNVDGLSGLISPADAAEGERAKLMSAKSRGPVYRRLRAASSTPSSPVALKPKGEDHIASALDALEKARALLKLPVKAA